ncbi:MAG: C4-dicarboxylate TRAP transporter substrate-binding protein [Fusobacterium gastrosuis]|uniref:C4-dicarboxylate TRAP transporter substrate-binding protein n=1 Tax=Fusobacterium TaxID=848 RepID=UPI0025BB39FB|nr:C4-dicarboxylate TRAP transporter substrate-binding protein [Fusobacterium sp.]MDD7410857.1 C4-dicarboxylate TRAP transporter substrate-binding protein [Fusobacteriaceae bacterium]MDY4011077.1 C4-dicarboxylate TRAP transporter substrate-binding protein [Fusobacterium gastrosuis]MCI5724973.1 C4-dicarboxylate TRAP transporter substrate-binding protein [Fusobacterium sp.]MCI7223049.1 C4-dicarboxylate TRAP transporter substrate-binding protein [Fusobacterium sp.]MDY5713210.1 C4-dicarboxylate TR
MKKLNIFKVVGLVVALFLLVACGKAKDENKEKVRVIKVSHVFQTSEPTHIYISQAADRINERLKGQIEFQVYPNAELPSYKDAIEQVLRGTDFVSVVDPSYIGDYIPDFTALVGPMLYKTYEDYTKVTSSDFVKDLERQAEEKGIKVLSLDFIFGFRHIVTNKEIKEPADLQGLKLRVPASKLWIDTFNALGANPVAMPWSETVSALQQNVIDGTETTYSFMSNSKLYELRKNVALSGHFLGTGGVYISTKVWDSFTDEQRKVIEEEIKQAAVDNIKKMQELDEQYRSDIEKNGMVLNEVNLEAFQEKTKKVFDEFPGFSKDIYQKIQNEIKK